MQYDTGGDQMTSFDHNMGSISVQWVTHRMQLFQFGQGIRNVQQRTVPIVARAFEQQRRGYIQVYHPPSIMQASPIFRIEDGPPAGSHYDVGTFRKLVDSLDLPPPKPVLALYLEDGWDGNPRPFNNLMI
jgi:hypothetical protein